MNSHVEPKIYAFKAGGAIVPYSFVKYGADDETLVQCSANDEAAIGVYQGSVAVVSGDLIEVALIGGGALIKLAATLARGAEVATNTAGLGKAAATGGMILGVLMASGVSGDVVPMLVHPYQKN